MVLPYSLFSEGIVIKSHMIYRVSFPFNLIFKKAIAVSGVYNLVDLLLIVFFIVTAVVGLNSYRRLRWLVLT
jgi:hypothetical protein